VLGYLRLAAFVAVELFMQVYLHFTALRIFFPPHTYNYLQQHTVKTALARVMLCSLQKYSFSAFACVNLSTVSTQFSFCAISLTIEVTGNAPGFMLTVNRFLLTQVHQTSACTKLTKKQCVYCVVQT